MHTIEPYYNWRHLYSAEEDLKSPFYGREYSEFYFSDVIYDHYIHPQWDQFGSPTLVLKILFTDYDKGFCIIELFGEWNDALNNDIMFLKRDVIDVLAQEGISKFILIAENVLNFHYSDDCYYEEWFDDVMEEDGWIVLLNSREHVMEEMSYANIDSYFLMGGEFDQMDWRTYQPKILFKLISEKLQKRLGLVLSIE